MTHLERVRARVVVNHMVRLRVEGAAVLDKAVTELGRLWVVIDQLPQSVQDDITDKLAELEARGNKS